MSETQDYYIVNGRVVASHQIDCVGIGPGTHGTIKGFWDANTESVTDTQPVAGDLVYVAFDGDTNEEQKEGELGRLCFLYEIMKAPTK